MAERARARGMSAACAAVARVRTEVTKTPYRREPRWRSKTRKMVEQVDAEERLARGGEDGVVGEEAPRLAAAETAGVSARDARAWRACAKTDANAAPHVVNLETGALTAGEGGGGGAE